MEVETKPPLQRDTCNLPVTASASSGGEISLQKQTDLVQEPLQMRSDNVSQVPICSRDSSAQKKPESSESDNLSRAFPLLYAQFGGCVQPLGSGEKISNGVCMKVLEDFFKQIFQAIIFINKPTLIFGNEYIPLETFLQVLQSPEAMLCLYFQKATNPFAPQTIETALGSFLQQITQSSVSIFNYFTAFLTNGTGIGLALFSSSFDAVEKWPEDIYKPTVIQNLSRPYERIYSARHSLDHMQQASDEPRQILQAFEALLPDSKMVKRHKIVESLAKCLLDYSFIDWAFLYDEEARGKYVEAVKAHWEAKSRSEAKEQPERGKESSGSEKQRRRPVKGESKSTAKEKMAKEPAKNIHQDPSDKKVAQQTSRQKRPLVAQIQLPGFNAALAVDELTKASFSNSLLAVLPAAFQAAGVDPHGRQLLLAADQIVNGQGKAGEMFVRQADKQREISFKEAYQFALEVIRQLYGQEPQ